MFTYMLPLALIALRSNYILDHTRTWKFNKIISKRDKKKNHPLAGWTDRQKDGRTDTRQTDRQTYSHYMYTHMYKHLGDGCWITCEESSHENGRKTHLYKGMFYISTT